MNDFMDIGGDVLVGRTALGQLVLSDGTQVWPVRCFPFSDPNGPISLCDEHGREVVFIPRLDALPVKPRTIVQEALEKSDFLPVITRILSVEPLSSEPNTWVVDTDRGTTSFTLQSDTNVRRLSPYAFMIVDAHGVRFLIPDVRRLDRRSRRFLIPYL